MLLAQRYNYPALTLTRTLALALTLTLTPTPTLTLARYRELSYLSSETARAWWQYALACWRVNEHRRRGYLLTLTLTFILTLTLTLTISLT